MQTAPGAELLYGQGGPWPPFKLRNLLKDCSFFWLVNLIFSLTGPLSVHWQAPPLHCTDKRSAGASIAEPPILSLDLLFGTNYFFLNAFPKKIHKTTDAQ